MKNDSKQPCVEFSDSFLKYFFNEWKTKLRFKTNLRCDENVNADDVNAKVDENVDDDGNDVDHAKGKSDAQKSLEQTGIKKA